MRGRFKFGLPLVDLSINRSQITVILDTGFNGDLLLPKKVIDSLGFHFVGELDYVIVDGKPRRTSVYTGKVLLGDKSIEVEVISTESNFALAGMNLLKNFRITLDKRENLVLVEE